MHAFEGNDVDRLASVWSEVDADEVNTIRNSAGFGRAYFARKVTRLRILVSGIQEQTPGMGGTGITKLYGTGRDTPVTPEVTTKIR